MRHNNDVLRFYSCTGAFDSVNVFQYVRPNLVSSVSRTVNITLSYCRHKREQAMRHLKVYQEKITTYNIVSTV